jgi:hypothetical protein
VESTIPPTAIGNAAKIISLKYFSIVALTSKSELVAISAAKTGNKA